MSDLADALPILEHMRTLLVRLRAANRGKEKFEKYVQEIENMSTQVSTIVTAGTALITQLETAQTVIPPGGAVIDSTDVANINAQSTLVNTITGSTIAPVVGVGSVTNTPTPAS